MFGLMKSKNPYKRAAHDVYGAVLGHGREAAFYTSYGVEDNFEGRFELLCLHVFAVMHVVLRDGGDEQFNQALFDVMFADMDQALRETGKGDMGVPKHMRRMMKGFNGKMNVYHELYGDAPAFEAAVRRNVYAEREGVPAAKMVDYIAKFVDQMNVDDILVGDIKTVPVH